MSGTKRATRVIYEDEYQNRQRRIRDLERKNRTLAEEARKNDVRHLIEATEQRVANDIQNIRNQMTRDARQAQLERLEVQKRMDKTFQEVAGVKDKVAGVRKEVKNTQHMITDIRKQIDHYEAEARRQRNQIRQDLNATKKEVKKNQDMISQNRQKIDRNYTEMKKGFADTLKKIDDMERKREAEKAMNASDIIDQVFAKMDSISKRFAKLHDPDYYNEAVGNYNKAVDLYESKKFDTSKRIAESAYQQFTNLNAQVERFRQQYETAYQKASTELSTARGSVNHLISDKKVELETAGETEKVSIEELCDAWFNGQPEKLDHDLEELEKLFTEAQTPAQLNLIAKKAADITTNAINIRDGVFEKHRQDEERAMLSEAIIRALSKDMEHVQPPYLERDGDLNSSLVIEHDKQPKVTLPLNGSFDMKFDKTDERGNMERAREFTRHLQKEGINVPEIERVD